jgi:hypothetical protein
LKTKLFAGVAMLATVVPVGGASAQDTDYYTGRITPNLTLQVRPKRDRTPPFIFTASGKVGRKRAGKSACRGRVTIRFRENGETLAVGEARVRPNCRYSKRFRLQREGRNIKVKARFEGNSLLRPRTAHRKTVRAG